MKLQIKLAYEAPEKTDGTRSLVDRLWPRGLARDRADVDRWLKDIAPYAELRRWFAHQPERWPEFRRRYFAELDRHPKIAADLRAALGKERPRFSMRRKDTQHNNARSLVESLGA